MTSKQRFEAQFEKCFRKTPTRPLTGIEKAAQESEEARRLWSELMEKGER